MKLKFFSTLAIISLGVLFYNCETSQTIAFLHKESQNYFDKREIDTEKFKRNIVDGILFTVDIEPADDGNISVWLGINSKHKLP
ncbi:MAG: hypothetical protein GY705_09585, partial [Bacteroidetes bacterium]|nr:hypothetical protein [Bacteroidota bacterium]